ncbi:MAG TPA: hypothetical protein VFE47_25320 [Tepidisphaeraceae bacterium]|jgi:hypothetical protein|nr:hypothetical protein [Tepidisphaeraceae bacterium]
MIETRPIVPGLFKQPVVAHIVTLTPSLADEKMMGEWWGEDCLRRPLNPLPIDRYWNWNSHEISYGDRTLTAEKVAVVTGAGEELAVQGAMMISSEPVASVTGRPCLLLELLFTAPRNRPDLRRDEQQYVVGVGTQLLIWAAWYSCKQGCDGRLRLDGSPDFLTWYEKRGLQRVKLDPIVYEDVTYTPMELSEQAAEKLLVAWDES